VKNSKKLTLKDIELARDRIKGIINKTNLDYSSTFSKIAENEVFLKPENLQKTGSFKVRGNLNAVSLLSEKEKRSGVITLSGGNHSQGFAWACSRLGIQSFVVLPKYSPKIKAEATKKYGSKVISYGTDTIQLRQKTVEISENKGLIFIDPMNDFGIIAGNGTIGLEILEDLPDVQAIVVPVSGGSLISGIATAVKGINPEVKIIGVQPTGANAMYLSFKNNRLSEVPLVETIADGLTAKKPGEVTFSIVKELVDEIVLVTDQEIISSMLLLLERAKLLVEPAGAASLAAVIYKRINLQNSKIVTVLSGGNIDLSELSAFIKSNYKSVSSTFSSY